MEKSITIDQVSFPSANRRVSANLFNPSIVGDGGRAVLFIHGDGSSQHPYFSRARSTSSQLAAICLTFDLSGHGSDAGNYGRYSVHEHLEDVVTAFDYLASVQGVDRDRIGVCGASYGAYLAALLTSRRPEVRRLILRAPSLVNDIKPPLPAETKIKLDSLRALALYPGPTLIVESGNDEVIPRSHIDEYVRACVHGERMVIAGAAHALTDARWDEAFVRAIVQWFGRL